MVAVTWGWDPTCPHPLSLGALRVKLSKPFSSFFFSYFFFSNSGWARAAIAYGKVL